MPEGRDNGYQTIVAAAERAAKDGAPRRAEALLREAVRVLEQDLGPAHPGLASTCNNLAVVCERNGNLRDAEYFYRRAHAVAASLLDAKDPLVQTSHENLRDFCAIHGVPLDDWPEIADVAAPREAAEAHVTSLSTGVRPSQPTLSTVAAGTYLQSVPTPAQTPPAAVPASSERQVLDTAPAPARPSPGVIARATRAAAAPGATSGAAVGAGLAGVLGAVTMIPTGMGATVAVAAVVATIAVASLWPAPDVSTSSQAIPAATAEAATGGGSPAAAPPVTDGPATRAPTPILPAAKAGSAPPSADARKERRRASPAPASPAVPAGAAVRLVTANVCASLDTTSQRWRCAAVAEATAPGRVSYYTRIASAGRVRVQHRWYEGDQLRQTRQLSIGYSPTEGYRTFTRQTLTPGRWRVELRDADGALLHEMAFEVRE